MGVFYEAFTQLIGFKNYGDEYKIMGLSSYGKPKYYNYIINNFFKNKINLDLNLKYFNHIDKNFSYKFKGQPNQSQILNKRGFSKFNIKTKNTQISKYQINLASSVQKIFEDKLMTIIKRIEKLNFSKNLVYAGGCALNSLANKKIYESKIFKRIFIPYAPGDGGGSIGSALVVTKKNITTKKLKIYPLHI